MINRIKSHSKYILWNNFFPHFFLDRYIKHHDQSRLDQEPSCHKIGHPVNAYHLIRHVALGWPAIDKDVLNNNTYLTQNLGAMIWNGVLDDICMY